MSKISNVFSKLYPETSAINEKSVLKLISDMKALLIENGEDIKLGNYPNLQKAIIELEAILKDTISDTTALGEIVDAKWSVNSNALGYKNPNSFRESFRNAIIGAKDGQDIVKRLEKEGGILDGWGKARGWKTEVIEEKPQYIKIGFGGQVVLTITRIERN